MNTTLIFLLIVSSLIDFIFTTTYTCDSNSTCGCSSLSTIVTSRIVGGEAAPNNAWGWMVSLRFSGKHRCGASLFSSQYAVTAAHCVEDVLNNPSSLSILAGTNYLNDIFSATAQQRIITKIIAHPNYDSDTIDNDIAILQFSPLTISPDSKLAFICLPAANQDPFQDGTNVVAIGWGVTSWGDSTVSQYLQQVTVQVISSTSAACLQSGMNNSAVQFCAGISTGGKDTCQGDSGGPLMSFVDNRWVLAGITSNGVKCALAGYPGVYTRVSAFVNFISANTKSSATILSSVTGTTELHLKPNNAIVVDKSRFLLVFCSNFLIFLSIFL